MSNKKEEIVNAIFFKRNHKILIDNNKDINQFYKLNLEIAIDNNKYISSSKYGISVKKCQLLYCELTIDNEIDIGFENGKLLSNDKKEILKDKELEENLINLVENETKKIREKLNLALSINENILSLGYCMDIELIKNVALYDEKQMKNFNIFLPDQINSFIKNNKNKNININNKLYEPAFPNFPNEHIEDDSFYFYYCKWLYNLETASTNSFTNSSFDPSTIPSSYKLIFNNIQIIKSNILYQFLFTKFFRDDLKLTIISIGEKNEFYQMITNRMSSLTPFDNEDITDLSNFIKYDENHLEYIPSDIPNKYNLGQISKLLFTHNKNISQKTTILPRFKEPVVDDVLNLALLYNNQTISYNINYRCNLDYYEVELIVELLKKCKRRYYDFIKKRTRWKNLFNELNYKLNKFNILYPDLYADKTLMDKYYCFNSIFLNRENKMIMYEEEENSLNNYFKRNLEKALNDNDTIVNSKKYNLTVKQCNFINCILTLNNTIELEYENAKCIRGAKTITDDSFMEILNSIIEKETDRVKEKLKQPLILIENLATHGYILSPDFIQIISFYDKYEIYELGLFLIENLKNIPSSFKYDTGKIVFNEKEKKNNNKKNGEEEDDDDEDDDDDDFSDSSFEQIYHDDDDEDQEEEEMEKYISEKIDKKVDPFYYHYCKWLYYVEKTFLNKGENLDYIKQKLPINYKENNKILNKIKEDDEKNTLQLEIIQNSGENEFYQMIQELIFSPTSFSSSDFMNITNFIQSGDNYWNYISKDIPNKNNLARIVNLIYKNEVCKFINYSDFFNSEIMNKIVSLFYKVNEVLPLIICMSYYNDIIPKLDTVQSVDRLNNQQIIFIFKILEHCDSTTRYEEFMKYRLIWSRFCGSIDHQELKKEHKEIIEDLLSVSKDYCFRSVLLRRRNKIFIDKKENLDLDTYYKNNLEKSIQNDKYLSSYPDLKIEVKRCHLLYCVLTLNKNQEMEFENGKLFTAPPSELTNITIEIETIGKMVENVSDDEDGGSDNDNDHAEMITEHNVDHQNMKLEETLMDHLKEIVEIETKNIRNKLNLVLSLNENIYSFGYIMEIDLIEILALYTPYELEELSKFFIEHLANNRKEGLPFPSFPNMYLDIKKAFYSSYCKWLYRLERIFHFDDTVIPMSFKKFLFNSNRKEEEKVKEKEMEEEEKEENEDNDEEEEGEGEEEEEEEEEINDEEEEEEDKEDNNHNSNENEKEEQNKNEVEDKKIKRKRIKYEMNIDNNDSGLKIIMLGERKELYQTIIRIMGAPEAGNSNDLTNIRLFIQYEKDHLKYIPETIQNKENLANIVHLLLKNYSNETIPEDAIIPLFKNVNDVLRLALVLSNHSASDLGKAQRFKSFSNPERRLLMKLLNNCGGDRYDDFLKYHNIWSRFFEKIHPLKFKAIYPDLIEDLLGTYRFIGDPKNKQLRMEYTFYQILLKLNERLEKYREDTIRLIQNKVPVDRARYYMNTYNISTVINDIDLLFNLEFLDQEDPNDNKNPNVNYDFVAEADVSIVRTIVKNLRINEVLTERELPLLLVEHEKIVEKFKNLKMLPEEMKTYLYPYIQNLVPIFSGGLKALNETYAELWDFYNNPSKEYYKEYVQAIKSNCISLYHTLIPVLDLDLIRNRMNEILPLINQLNERARNYRQERQTFNSKWVELISKKKIEEAAKLLSRKPGIFIRQLDELITKSENESQSNLILQLFEEVANKTSIKVLLSMKGYFQKRTTALKGRAFLVQGGVKNKKLAKNDRLINVKQGVVTETHTVIYYTTKVKKPLDEEMCQRIVRICDETLIRNFQNKSKLNQVYISPDIQKFIIPYDLRSVKRANGKMYSKGTRISIKSKNITEEYREKIIEDLERKLEKNKEKVKKFIEKKGRYEVKYINRALRPSNNNTKKLKFMEKKLDILKSFVKKNEEELETMKNYNYNSDSIFKYIRLFVVGDYKLTLELYDDDLQLKRMYPTLKKYDHIYPNPYGHRKRSSSDESDDEDDEDEMHKRENKTDDEDLFYYYKLDEKFYDIDLEKIVQNGIRYIMIHIEDGDDVKFGWMERRALNSSELFNPEKHLQNFTFNYNKAACPLILDCKTSEFIWIDKEINYSYYGDFRNILEYVENMDKDPSVEISRITNEVKRKKYMKKREKNKKCFDRNLKLKHSLFYYYLEPLKISINDLIQLHIKARDGTQVESEEELKEGDLAFLSEPPLLRKDDVHYIFYHQHDTILSNYMS